MPSETERKTRCSFLACCRTYRFRDAFEVSERKPNSSHVRRPRVDGHVILVARPYSTFSMTSTNLKIRPLPWVARPPGRITPGDEIGVLTRVASPTPRRLRTLSADQGSRKALHSPSERRIGRDISLASLYSTMPAPRRGFSRPRDIGTASSNVRFAILFMAT
jgi:hypothetical protein